MDMTALANSPIAIGIISGIIGILIGWFFTRRGWRKRAETAESRAADLAAAQRQDKQEMDDSTAQVKSLTKQVEQLQASLEAAEDDLGSIRSKASNLETEVESAHEEEAEADSTADARESEAADLRMQLSLLQEEFDAATQNAASEVEQARTEAEALAAIRIALDAELAALREEKENSQLEMTSLQTQVDETGEGSHNKDIALNEAYAHAVAVQQQMEECEEACAAAQSELEEMQNEVASLTAARGELELRVQQSRSDVAGDLAVLTSTMLKIKDDALDEANDQIAALTKEVETLRG